MMGSHGLFKEKTMKKLTQFVLGAAVVAGLVTAAPQASPAPQGEAKGKMEGKMEHKAKRVKADATPAPTAAEITDAKAKGLVWVNTNSGVYRKDGELYGKTKHGKFMTEAEAQTAGHHLAKEPGQKAVKTAEAAKDKMAAGKDKAAAAAAAAKK